MKFSGHEKALHIVMEELFFDQQPTVNNEHNAEWHGCDSISEEASPNNGCVDNFSTIDGGFYSRRNWRCNLSSVRMPVEL